LRIEEDRGKQGQANVTEERAKGDGPWTTSRGIREE